MRNHDKEHFITAKSMLNAVEDWAGSDYWVVRETTAGIVGRIDGLLVPSSFDSHVLRASRGSWIDKAAITGIEVKASRADFMRGLREGQFDRYASDLAGLYVATQRSVKTSEIPNGIGHLVVYRPPERHEWACVCKRHPDYRPVQISQEVMWRLLFYAIRKMRESNRHNDERLNKALEKVGAVASRQIMSMLRKAAETAA